jgi:hypothetical protein
MTYVLCSEGAALYLKACVSDIALIALACVRALLGTTVGGRYTPMPEALEQGGL